MNPLQHFLYVLAFLLSLIQIVVLSSQSSYTPVTALDKYGHSIQLQNAREAAARHGRLIVAASTASNEETVVISVYTPKMGLLHHSKTDGVLQKLWTDESKNNDAPCHLACTGVKADATWLIQTMRQYAKRVWDRYDIASISQERMTQALSRTLVEFMGYNRAREWQDGVGVEKSGGDDASSWARPLGIQTLIISPSSPIVLVEPSGVAQTHEYVAIGKDSSAVMRALRERFPSNAGACTVEELKELLMDVIQKTIEGQKSSTELIVEVVSKHGVEVSSVPLKRIR